MQVEVIAKRIDEGKIERISAALLKKGSVVLCEAGDIIPADGEVVEGIAAVDDGANTGESATVIRERAAGVIGSCVTAGTKVVSDQLKIKITSEPGNTFLDRIIHLIEARIGKKLPMRLPSISFSLPLPLFLY